MEGDVSRDQHTEPSYCVVCRMNSQGAGTIRVVGPFDSQEAAVNWAVEMRAANRAWSYTPDVMDPPPAVTA